MYIARRPCSLDMFQYQIPVVEMGWENYKFPKRLFIMGAGPSLQLLYDNKEEAQHWGDWAEIRSDICTPILKTIKAMYSIRLNPILREKLHNQGEIIAPTTSRPSDKYREIPRVSGSTLSEFLLLFEEHGGEEAFLFGFDGDGSGYWREKENPKYVLKGTSEKEVQNQQDVDTEGHSILEQYQMTPATIKTVHRTDCLLFNSLFLPATGLKLYHIGNTSLDIPSITIDTLKKEHII